MSDTDSFIEEVNEEVRRDRLYGYLKRYGWIAVLAIVLIVGGAAWSEYRKSQERAKAEALGDAMLAALANNDSGDRAAALAEVSAEGPAARAVLGLLTAAQQAEAEDAAGAIATLDALASNGEIPQTYRQVAQFKSLILQSGQTPDADRLLAFESFAQPGNPMRLLAEEQIALIEITQDKPEAAIARYQAILEDAEVSPDLQQRARQVIVALGGEPEIPDGTLPAAGQATSGDN